MRRVLVPRGRHETWKYGNPHATVHAAPRAWARSGARGRKGVLEGARARPERSAASTRDARRDDLVMERRNGDLDAVVLDRPHSVEHVLLRRQRACRRAGWRRARELVDELVRAGRTESADGGAGENLLAGELHADGGTRTRLRSKRVTFRFTCANEKGGATCSLTTYVAPPARQRYERCHWSASRDTV